MLHQRGLRRWAWINAPSLELLALLVVMVLVLAGLVMAGWQFGWWF